jgi:hypothetical protein
MMMTTSTSFGTSSVDSYTYLELAGRIDWLESGSSTGTDEMSASESASDAGSWLAWAA